MTEKKTKKDWGYGFPHQKEKDRWRRLVASGTVRCSRCLRYIEPGDYWDLGHDDMDRSIYTGPEHRHCNRRAGGRKGGRSTARKRSAAVVGTWSRRWLDD